MTKTVDLTSEEYREYVTTEGFCYRINSPERLHILDNGSHRVVDQNGVTHRPPRFGSDYAIRWLARDGSPKFTA